MRPRVPVSVAIIKVKIFLCKNFIKFIGGSVQNIFKIYLNFD